MIRFIDLTPFYYADTDDSSPPVCAFVDTTTDRFLMADGEHVFSSSSEIDNIENHVIRERCRRLVPVGFWNRAEEEE